MYNYIPDMSNNFSILELYTKHFLSQLLNYFQKSDSHQRFKKNWFLLQKLFISKNKSRQFFFSFVGYCIIFN